MASAVTIIKVFLKASFPLNLNTIFQEYPSDGPQRLFGYIEGIRKRKRLRSVP